MYQLVLLYSIHCFAGVNILDFAIQKRQFSEGAPYSRWGGGM